MWEKQESKSRVHFARLIHKPNLSEVLVANVGGTCIVTKTEPHTSTYEQWGYRAVGEEIESKEENLGSSARHLLSPCSQKLQQHAEVAATHRNIVEDVLNDAKLKRISIRVVFQ